MKWEMEIEEIEAVLEKICDLHNRLSDAIHSVSRAHFLNSIKNLRKSHNLKSSDDNGAGFVYLKDFQVESDSAVQEAESLNAIRTALENLECQLEFFHTIQSQQRAERDAAIARLEQSRIVLAMRLAEHKGKKYKVIEEAQALVGDVKGTDHFISRESTSGQSCSQSGENFVADKGKGSNIVMNVLVSSFNFVKRTLSLDNMNGIVGNAALVAISMVAFLHLNHVAHQEPPHRQENSIHSNRTERRKNQHEGSTSKARSSNLNLLLARG